MSNRSRKPGSSRTDRELIFVLEPDAGRVTVEISQSSTEVAGELQKELGCRMNLNCAKPVEQDIPIGYGENPVGCESTVPDNFSIWLYRLYHDSVVDGPGRRSVVQLSGCSIRCTGCYVPQTHERGNGVRTSIGSIVRDIVANRERHDGVTIIGGEPFDQSGEVAELIARLKQYGLHVTVYSGYTLEDLISRKQPSVDYILTHIDLLIDGPFMTELSDKAGEYRGSRNQRLINTPMQIN